MKNGRLTRYMEAGLPHLRQVSRLPGYLAPGVSEVASQLGDKSLLELAEPLCLSEGIKSLLNQAPEADKLPAEIWQESICRWRAIHQVAPVILALLRAREKVEALGNGGA